jgi:hypothetical protein
MSKALQYDVVIIGAGSAGLAAAVQASRCGAKVALVERLTATGGKATAAEVRTLCGFYFSGRKQAEFLHKGFPREFAERIMELEQTQAQSFDKNLYFISYHPYSFKWLADEFLKEHKVDVFYQSYPINISQDEKSEIDSLSIVNKDRVLHLNCKMLIDTSGESVISAMLDLPQISEEAYQVPTQVFTINNIDLPNDAMLNMLVNKSIISAVKSGEIPEEFDRLNLVPGSFKNGTASFKFSLKEERKDSVNNHTKLEVIARDRVGLIYLFLKENLEGFQNAQLDSMAPELGIRVGRRTLGKHILTKADVINSAKFEDVVAIGAWPIEKWGTEKRVSMTYPESGEFYEIPLRCLQSVHCDNLLVAGRNISADADAIASARVIGICMATGAAAGAYAAKKAHHSSDKEALSFINRELLLNL